MADQVFQQVYLRFAPRWLKAMRWREFGQRCVEKQKLFLVALYLPVFHYYFLVEDPYTRALKKYKPKTEEELLTLKRDYKRDFAYNRNWELGEYDEDQPPLYDLFTRRKKYPQYYENKYDKYKSDRVM